MQARSTAGSGLDDIEGTEATMITRVKTASVRAHRLVLLAAMGAIGLAGIATQPSVHAQGGEVSGPGQNAPIPQALCPDALACNYMERNVPDTGYRVQALEVCGANCTTQYWVVLKQDRKPILQIDPIRGGGIVAIKRSDEPEARPAVRTIIPNYAPTDPACCPSGFSDITYTWDELTEALSAGDPIMIPAEEFGGWDAARERLSADAFRDPLQRR